MYPFVAVSPDLYARKIRRKTHKGLGYPNNCLFNPRQHTKPLDLLAVCWLPLSEGRWDAESHRCQQRARSLPCSGLEQGFGLGSCCRGWRHEWWLLKTSTKALGALDPVAVLSFLVGLLQHCGYEHTPLSAISKVRS